MKIVNVIGRALSEEERKSMEQFRSYTDGVSFACLRQGVMVMLHDEPSKDAEKLKAKALEHIRFALSTHPDLNTWKMDDGHLMVAIPGGVFAMSADALANPAPIDYFVLRGQCLLACEEGSILAVAYEEE